MDQAIGLADIEPIHTAIAGRARFQVKGLKGSERLRHSIEKGLPGTAVHRVEASALTGRILVHFDQTKSIGEIQELIRQVLAVSKQQAPDDLLDDTSLWHVQGLDEVYAALASRPSGFSQAEAQERLALAGPNTIGVVPGRSRFEILADQLQSLPVALLGASAVLSLVTGGLVDAAVILSVIALNAGVGYATESHAEKTINALDDDGQASAVVMRDGLPVETPIAGIVPGDILDLRAGAVIAADARLIQGNSLTVSEAILTWESVPVVKKTRALPPGRHALAERINMVFRGTMVTGGSGRALVVATGQETQLGKIQLSIGSAEAPQTPLQRQLTVLGRQLVGVSLAGSAALFVIGMLRGNPFLPTLKVAISLAVAAVPEGLPVLATTTLALGISNLRRKAVLIRRLPAVEGLSAVQVICFDKTGTLTLNRMAVARIVTADRHYHMADGRIREGDVGNVRSAQGKRRDLTLLLEMCVLCSDADIKGEEVSGTSTEAALVKAALAAGLDADDIRRSNERLAVFERTEERLYMKTEHRTPAGQVLTAVKGSPGDVLGLCQWIWTGNERLPLDASGRQSIAEENHKLADAALRVLGVAFGLNGDDEPKELVWLGLVGMADPVRPDARRIIESFHRAGISTLMITGDQPATAAAIASELGLKAVNGDHLNALAPPLREGGPQHAGHHVFSRVTPVQKLRIIETLQSAGLVVAMTGDGVNDAPSLRAADIGIALGGTEIARQSADVVLMEDELQGLVVAISNGRATYDNIRRAITYLLATNFSEIAMMLTVTATGIGRPLTPIQLLWVNLVTDVLPAIGLALEPPAAGLMNRSPRNPEEQIISRQGFHALARDGVIMTSTALAAHLYAHRRHGATPRSGAIGFASLVSAQLLHALRHRAARPAGGGGRGNIDYLAGGLALSSAAQAAALFMPGLRQLFGGPIDLMDAGVVLATSASALALSAAFSPPEARPGLE